MKATKHIFLLTGFLLAAAFCKAQTQTTDSIVSTQPAAVTDSTIVIKAPLYDTGQANAYCPGCGNTNYGVNNNHITPYYTKGKQYADPTRTANMKPGVLSMDGGKPSIGGARTSGTAYYYNGIRLLDNAPSMRFP